MCGIFCSISRSAHIQPDAAVLELLRRRGPDSTGLTTSTCKCENGGANTQEIYLTFVSTVLSLRGSQTITQPRSDLESSRILCWNGEAWSIAGTPTSGNDTAAVFDLLQSRLKTHTGSTSPERELGDVAQSLATVAGPYAFVFYNHASGKLYFGRDFLGRRSLLYKIFDGDLLLSSVTSGHADGGWTEVEADGVYCLDLKNQASLSILGDQHILQWGDFLIHRHAYAFATDQDSASQSSAIPLLSLNEQIPSSVSQLTQASKSVEHIEQLMRDSISLRILNIPDPPSPATATDCDARPTRLAILFSGGLDCTLLARLCHDILPAEEPIDLLNVAFENPRIHKPSTDDPTNTTAYESCPDRITGRSSYAELQQTCPGRIWRFVAINIPYRETVQHRDTVITLMHPHNTEMDLSIANALYFAARGAGLASLAPSDEPGNYTTPARVLLSGLGADELFAGYTRHATAFSRHRHQGLIDELNLDIWRLGKRNLGRDDRVISNWGREARFPFLDEKVVGWALAAPVNEKCDFGADIRSTADESARLESGKKVLRCLAWKLGMKSVAAEKKRAIQFGARTAKMTTGKSKGTTLLS